MKYIFTAALFLGSLFSALPAHACDCITILTFCESVRPENPVLLGVVTRHYGSGSQLMDVRVLGWIKSPGFSISDITIVGGSSAICLVETNSFMVGDTLLLTPHLLSTPPLEARHLSFNLFGCAVPFLRVNNGVVRGAIRDGLNEAPLSSLISELGRCMEGIVLDDMKLFPNPVGSRFQVQLSGVLFPEQIRFFNVLGQEVVLSSSLDETKSLLTVDTESLSAGVYFAMLQYGRYRRTFKWVKS